MRLDQTSESVGGAARACCDRLGDLDEAAAPVQAHHLERALLGGKIVVEARLPYAEHIGDVLCGGTMKATLGEHARRRLDDFRRALARAGPPRGPERYDRHVGRLSR